MLLSQAYCERANLHYVEVDTSLGNAIVRECCWAFYYVGIDCILMTIECVP